MMVLGLFFTLVSLTISYDKIMRGNLAKEREKTRWWGMSQRSRGSGFLQRQILSLSPPAPNTHIDHTRVNTIYLFTFHGCLKLKMTVTWTVESSTMSSPGSPFLPSCAHLNCISARAPRPSRVGPIMSSGHPGCADAVGRNVSMVEWHKPSLHVMQC